MDFTDLPKDIFFFYTIVLTYFIFLFHSFDIKDIKEKVSGVEILFISGAVGIVFYLFLKQITTEVIIPTISLLQKIQIPLTIWYYPPSIIEYALNIAIQLIIAAICWFTFAIIFYFTCKSIQFCFDPEKKIFPPLNRFKFIEENNIRNIALFRVPIILIYVSCIVIIFGYDYDFLQKMQGFIVSFQYRLLSDFYYALYGFIGILISFAFLFLIVRLLLRELGFLQHLFGFLTIWKKEIEISLENSISNFQKYQDKVIHSNLKRDWIERWIFKHWKWVIAVLGILIIIFLILVYIEPIYFGMKCYVHSDVNKVLCLPKGPFISQKIF